MLNQLVQNSAGSIFESLIKSQNVLTVSQDADISLNSDGVEDANDGEIDSRSKIMDFKNASEVQGWVLMVKDFICGKDLMQLIVDLLAILFIFS